MRSSCDLMFSGLSSNPCEVSGTVFLPLNRCKSTAFFEFRGFFNVFDVCVCVFFVCVRMRVCARTVAVDGQVCEYARVKVCVRVRWCMSASVRSHVWAMVYVCASVRACLDYLWCVFV